LESGNLKELVSAITNLEENKVYEIVKKMLESGENPERIIEDLRKGMEIIGDEYSKCERALCDLIMASEILKSAMRLLEPSLKTSATAKTRGNVVIGTVQGDIHDIGKNIVISLLGGAGFTIYDLGVDVPPEKFVEKVMETGAKVVAMSGLLTVSYPSMKETVRALKRSGIRDKVKIIIGGAFVNEKWRKDIEADAYTKNAYEGVEIIKRFVGEA
jgi:methylmalonyl-CoA mutase cobalamin-binding domain/chain